MRYFTFNNQTSEDYGIIVNKIRRPVLPELRPRKLIIPGKDGAWDFGNNTYEEISIGIDCTLVQPISKRALIRSLSAWLSQKSELSFSDEAEKYYIGRIYATFAEEIEGAVGSFTIEFICDPYAYAAQEAYNDTYIWDDTWIFDAGLYWPNESTFDWLYFRQGMCLYNYSPQTTDIIITVTGSVEGVKITHTESGKFLDLGVTISSETVIINTETYTIEDGSGNNLLNSLSLDSEFFKIQSEVNSFIFEGVGPDCVVNYTWKHKFL